MIEIIRYTPKYKAEWNNFVAGSKNGIFQFYRDYMEYHADRFKDFSLMFLKDNVVMAILPAHIQENVLVSHGGLTFGGFITNHHMRVSLMLQIFTTLREYLKGQGVSKLIYKCVPHIYHVVAAEEDRYALFLNHAKLVRRDVTSTIYLPNMIEYNESKYRAIKKAKRSGITVTLSQDYETYWSILTDNLLTRYNKRPVHTLKEILYLKSKFPNEIKLFAAYKDNMMVAGVVIYESNKNVAHAQYIANSETGRKLCALDALFDYVIAHYKDKKKFFDFGISTEDEGQRLNENLIFFKESFGARAVVHDFYEVDV